MNCTEHFNPLANIEIQSNQSKFGTCFKFETLAHYRFMQLHAYEANYMILFYRQLKVYYGKWNPYAVSGLVYHD